MRSTIEATRAYDRAYRRFRRDSNTLVAGAIRRARRDGDAEALARLTRPREYPVSREREAPRKRETVQQQPKCEPQRRTSPWSTDVDAYLLANYRRLTAAALAAELSARFTGRFTHNSVISRYNRISKRR